MTPFAALRVRIARAAAWLRDEFAPVDPRRVKPGTKPVQVNPEPPAWALEATARALGVVEYPPLRVRFAAKAMPHRLGHRPYVEPGEEYPCPLRETE